MICERYFQYKNKANDLNRWLCFYKINNIVIINQRQPGHL